MRNLILEKLRTAGIIVAFAAVAMLILPPLFPRPNYDYVMDRYYRLAAAAVIGAIAGIGVEWVIRTKLSRRKK